MIVDWDLPKLPPTCVSRDVIVDAAKFIHFDHIPKWEIGRCLQTCTTDYRGKEEVECFDACLCRAGVGLEDRDSTGDPKSCLLPEILPGMKV